MQRTHGFGVSPAAWSSSHGSHDAGAERVAQVEREVRQAHAVREAARGRDGAGRAARLLAVVERVAPQLERDRDGVVPGAQRGDGGVHAAAHGHERAAGVGAQRPVGGHGEPERARQGVGRDLGGVQLAGAQPAECGGDLRGPHARRVEHGRAADELHRRAGRGVRGAAARGLEAGVGHPVARDGDPQARHVAAGGAARDGLVGAVGDVAGALREAQVLLEALVGHRGAV